MKQYQKKPERVLALRYNPAVDGVAKLKLALCIPIDIHQKPGGIVRIYSRYRGKITGEDIRPGDYVVQKQDNELRVLDPTTFASLYEEVPEYIDAAIVTSEVKTRSAI